MASARLGCLVFFMVALASCKTAELSHGGKAVTTGQGGPPAPSCESLGPVVGTGGGAFGGAYLSNEQLMEYALNDLRNKAAAKGANYVTHGQPQLGTAGNKENVNTTTATVAGTAYRCPSNASAPSDAVAVRGASGGAAAPSQPAPEPQGVAGFVFGVAPDEAESVCANSGHDWRPRERKDYFACSGVPRPVGHDVAALLRFCDGKLCWIRLSGAPSPLENAGWTKVLTDFRTALEKKYGAPDTSEIRIPQRCLSESLHECLRDGSASAKLEWTWPTRHVRFTVDKADGDPAFRLLYSAKLIDALESDAL